MEALKASFFPSLHTRTMLHKTQFRRPMFLNFHFNQIPSSSFSFVDRKQSKFKAFTTISSTVSTEPTNPPELEPELETPSQGEKFDWYSQWYPVMPVCDLDKRRPHAKRVIGLDVVVWWDRNEEIWKVFDDRCPHRLAPLSEGRIDQWGRLQCVYHGWCFNGSGDCKFIPQAPPEGPPADREGGRPLELKIDKLDINGFKADQEWSNSKFLPPCVFYANTKSVDQANGSESSVGTKKETSVQRSYILVFICIPVSPGNSRLIWTLPRNFGVWIDKVVPRWMFHVGQNLILDSDLYLLHIEERKIMDVGNANWHKACFVPTKSDALVIGFRKWLNKYAGGQVDWRGKYSGALPPTPPKEQLMDRYWSHVVNCRSCNIAYKGLNALELVLQVVSIVSIGIAAAAKQGAISAVARTTMVLLAVLCEESCNLLTLLDSLNNENLDSNPSLL
ncbi:hypothetical protein SO802_019400 [Lithocarpus litseifolius]|uniref:Rieske domain-containing protein n=1 Tax=Lithocarpus litseifolius TaxID=425828 RepID=A0AAW2CQX1_9ROSI